MGASNLPSPVRSLPPFQGGIQGSTIPRHECLGFVLMGFQPTPRRRYPDAYGKPSPSGPLVSKQAENTSVQMGTGPPSLRRAASQSLQLRMNRAASQRPGEELLQTGDSE